MPNPSSYVCSSLAAVLAVAGLAGSAAGQCTVYRIGMPDFDQRRDTLPNDGRMYCVPTATANALAYISNHGHPEVFGGPKDWSSSTQYTPVSTQLIIMGTLLMGTSPTTGTNMGGWTAGTKAMLSDSPGLIAGSYLAIGFQGLSPHQLADQMRIGSVVMPLIGWYDDVGFDRWSRDGGHMVTMHAAFNTCAAPEDMLLAYHDPDDSSDLGSQSPFRTIVTQFTTDPTWRFRRRDESGYFPRQVMRVNSNGGFLDGFGAIWPMYGLSTGPGLTDISFDIPQPGSDDPGAKRFTIDMSPGYEIMDLSSTALPTEGFVLGSTGGGRQGLLLHANFVNDQLDTVDTMINPLALVVGRDGSAYVASNAKIDRYAVQAGGEHAIIDTTALPAPANAMFYDDATDQVVALNVSSRRLMIAGQDLTLLRNDALPSGVPLGGDVSLAINPVDGKEWIAASGSPMLTELERDAAGRLRIDSQISLPGVTSPQGLQFGDDGALFVVDGGIIKAFQFSTRGGWQRTDSPLDGMPSGPVFMAGRGRTNYDPATMDDINILPPSGDPGELDCRADLNLDGNLDIFDFLEFQNLFVRGSTWADFDYDSELTIFDFLAFQNAFDAGC
ncbi:MAG: hypothetical protein NCW75_14870 [Phycisphaera sp.]|nr:MAG: hypothetical protein NCW75_14870 [Phycisphaera sp.]